MSTLSVVNNAVTLPGVAFKRNALLFEKELSLDQLNGLAASVTEMEGGVAWWLGDIGLAIQAGNRARNEDKAARREQEAQAVAQAAEALDGAERNEAKDKARRLLKEAVELRQDDGSEYRAGRAEAMGINPGYWANAVMVARYFPPSLRNEALHFQHHYLAIGGAGGVNGSKKVAQAWLREAADGNWTVAEMRKQVNMRRAVAAPAGQPEGNPWEPMDEADRWLTQRTGEEITPAAARNLLTRWQKLIEFVRRLEAVAANG